MAQIYSQSVHADVKVVLSIEVSEELKALLTAQGWTPPGEEPILKSEHRSILAEQAARSTRAEVAEEIAKDLEKSREWRISLEKPTPWADVARAHAGGKPSEIPFPPNPITWSGQNCATFGCALDHGDR